jgi:protein tyrosine kinase modulator
MRPAGYLRPYGAVFRNRAWIIALVSLLAVGGALGHVATQPPRYQAETSILVPALGIVPAVPTDARLVPVQSLYRQTVLNDIVHLLRSRTISEQAAEEVGGLSGAEVARRVTVSNIPGTDFLLIRAADTQPERAAQIANAMAQALGDFYSLMSQAGATRARMFIEQQLRLAQDRLGAAEQAALAFQARTGAQALPEDVSLTEQRILDLQAAYEAAMLDETTARTRVDAIRAHLASQNDGQLASLSIATNPVIAQIRDHLTGLELRVADLRQTYTDQHPAVKALLGQIAADQARLSAEAAKALTDTSLGMSPARAQFVGKMIDGEVDVAAAHARAAGIRAIIDRVQARLANVPSDALALARLEREAKDAEQLVASLSALRQESVMRESQAVASGQSAVVVVDQALAPGKPVTPPYPQTAALAGLLGVCLGAALALAVDAVEKRIRTSRRPAAAHAEPEPAVIPVLRARLGYRSLAAALGMAAVLLPVLLVALVMGIMLVTGVGAAMYGAQIGAATGHLAHSLQALVQGVQAVHGLFVAQARAVPVHVAHVGQALMQALSAVQ